jgi:hypothetical protein
MTVFVKNFPDWVGTEAYSLTESYITWLIANIGAQLRTEQGAYDDDMVDRYPDGIDHAARWRIKCVKESSFYQIHKLQMYYGDGWQVMKMRGRDCNYVYDEEIVIAVYDELFAMQFKLACL